MTGSKGNKRNPANEAILSGLINGEITVQGREDELEKELGMNDRDEYDFEDEHYYDEEEDRDYHDK